MATLVITTTNNGTKFLSDNSSSVFATFSTKRSGNVNMLNGVQ